MTNPPFVIGIVGSRRRTRHEDYEKLYNELMKTIVYLDICEPVMFVSGGCPVGADSWAEDIAKEKNIPIKVFNPDFEKYGSPAAFFVRNDLIAKEADILIALVAEDRQGGTEGTIKMFQKYHPGSQVKIL